jgi:hypothetical protein
LDSFAQFLAFAAIWVLLQLVVFPRLGIPT